LLWGCASTGAGLSSCDGVEEFEFPTSVTNTVNHGVHAGITSAGASFLYEDRETLAALFLPVGPDGWVPFPIPPSESGNARVSITTRDINISFDLRTANLDFEFLGNPTRARFVVEDARARFDDGIVIVTAGADSGGGCRLGNGISPNQSGESFALVDITVDLIPTIGPNGYMSVSVSVGSLNLREVDLDLEFDPDLPECSDGGTSVECRLICGASDLGISVTELLFESLANEIEEYMEPILETVVNQTLAELTEEPVGIEGSVSAQNLSATIPFPRDAHPLQFKGAPSVNGFALIESDVAGVALSMDIGMDAISHPCVDPLATANQPVLGPVPELTGYDHDGQPYHLGLSIAGATLNRALWSVWRAGLFCLTLDTEELEALAERRIDSETLGLFLPSLGALATQNAPIMLVIQPGFTADNFPLVELQESEGMNGFPQIGLAATLPNIGIDLYAMLNGRWSRLFQMNLDAAVSLAGQATPDNRILITADPPTLEGFEQTYNELLATDRVPELLNLLLDVALSSLLQDGLAFDLGIDEAISSIEGLPYSAQIAGLEPDGAENDYLSVLLRLVRTGNGLQAYSAVNTVSEIRSIEPGRVVLNVESIGAQKSLFQWRMVPGPWRPMRRAHNGTLVVKEPRLLIPGEHLVEVRSVDETDYQRLDPTPVAIDVVIPSQTAPQTMDHEPQPTASNAVGGCHIQPSGNSNPWWIGFGVLLIVLMRTKRWQLLLISMLFMGSGCDDRPTAPDVRCQVNLDCPRGLSCLEGICQARGPCSGDDECCVLEACLQGDCVPMPHDDCEVAGCTDNRVCINNYCYRPLCESDDNCMVGRRCVEGFCVRGSPCNGSCESTQACFVHRDTCRQAPVNCMSCEAGEVRVVHSPTDHNGPSCDLNRVTCECIALREVRSAVVIREADMAMLRGEPIFVAYESRFGDLVFLEEVEAEEPLVSFIDGVPLDAPASNEPDSIRGGIVDVGPDVGRYPTMAVDDLNRVHVAYHDASEGDLRYTRRDVDGTWITPVVIDAAGNAGLFPEIRVDGLNRPHIVYTVADSDEDDHLVVRYAVGNENPQDPDAFRRRDIWSRQQARPEADDQRVDSELFYPRPCMDLTTDGTLVTAFVDPSDRRPIVARGGINNFVIQRLIAQFEGNDPGGRYTDVNEHPMGRFCDIVKAGDDIHLVIPDEQTWSLISYRGPFEGPGIISEVDGGSAGSRQLIGADPVLYRTQDDRLFSLYQDAANNDLRLNLYDQQSGWGRARSVAFDGALGFDNSLHIEGDQAIIGTVELRTTTGGRDNSRARIFRLNLN